MSRHHKRRGRFTRPKAPRKFVSFDIETYHEVRGARLLPPGIYGVTLASADYSQIEDRLVAHFAFDVVPPAFELDNAIRGIGGKPDMVGVRTGRFSSTVPNMKEV